MHHNRECAVRRDFEIRGEVNHRRGQNSPTHPGKEPMPLVRIDLIEGKPIDFRAAVGEVVYRTLMDVLGVPEHDRFQIITEHKKDAMPYAPDYLGIHKTDDTVFIQITLNSGRSTGLKQRFYKALADGLHEAVKLRREDVLVNLVEVPKENWSFGNGEAQYVDKAS
jgi:4-oxalocrotonate tautomerase